MFHGGVTKGHYMGAYVAPQAHALRRSWCSLVFSSFYRHFLVLMYGRLSCMAISVSFRAHANYSHFVPNYRIYHTSSWLYTIEKLRISISQVCITYALHVCSYLLRTLSLSVHFRWQTSYRAVDETPLECRPRVWHHWFSALHLCPAMHYTADSSSSSSSTHSASISAADEQSF